ncbi:hypothetical protein E1200_19685 [Actinomadura sp. GC306]|uniref:HPF/RaiA family ribosome-associated protein n=1 Tax=Actinomadura sp. GC306 TaxID=2530367 RepID=UPI00104F2F92|nr:hypothetical protein [Actinomadura sp. GC306]TDC64746.1 hypothetical protein E1200_19685 [Actinomadura sp. GC306]
MPGTGQERLDIQFTTVNDVSPADVERAREAIGRVLTHPPRPVLYAKVTLNKLRDPAVAHPYLVSVRIDLNGRPVNAYASGATMPEAIGLAAARLRARVGHLAGYWEARRRRQRDTAPGARRHDETKELHDA